MDDDVREVSEELGRKALARDWAGVHQMLAPWMGRTSRAREPISFAGNKIRRTLGFDFFCEIWMAVVQTDQGLRVGYWGQGAY